MSTFRHSGEVGDCVYLLPLLRALGGKHSIFLADRVTVPPFSRPIVAAAPLIIPLLQCQSYIEKVRCTEEPCDIDMSKFRMFHSPTTTLTFAQVAYYNDQTGSLIKENGSEPWLSVDGERKPSGKITIARSSRYNNPLFPWKKIVEHYGKRLQFVGLAHEHKSFIAKYGNVKHAPVKDFLAMAKLIRDSELFIGNQSGPQAVAMGLGVPIIQETFIHQSDCIFDRSNVKYCHDGGCILPDIGESGELKIESTLPEPDLEVNRNIVPPKLWQYPGASPASHFQEISRVVMQLEGCTALEADKKILIYNIKRCPEFFNQGVSPDYNVIIAINNSRLGSVFK